MDDLLIAAVATYGRNWKTIGETEFIGRSSMDLKNRYVKASRHIPSLESFLNHCTRCTILDRRQRQTLGLSESECLTSVGSVTPEADTASTDRDTYSESTRNHVDTTALDLNEIDSYTENYSIHDSFSAETSLYSHESSAFLQGRSGQDGEFADLEDPINLWPSNPDSYPRQLTPTMDPWDGASLISDPMQSWVLNIAQSNEQTGSVDSSQCIESLKNLHSSQTNEQGLELNPTQDDTPCVSGAESQTTPVVGSVHSMVLQDVQPETLNTIMDTLLKSGTKFTMTLFDA